MVFDVSAALVEKVESIAARAAAQIMRIRSRGFTVEYKDDSSPVTEADQAAEELIISAIHSGIGAAWPIVAEEQAAGGNLPDPGDGLFWLIDPLDGTKGFINKNSEFTVNIALIEDRAPILGVVHAPALGEAFVGSSHGAFTRTADGVCPIACRKAPSQGLSVLVSCNHKSPQTDDFLKAYSVAQKVGVGSSLKFCRVAAGRADLYPRFGRTMEWDTAAGHGVLRYAGGAVTLMDGGDFLYAKPKFENPHFIAHGKGAFHK